MILTGEIQSTWRKTRSDAALSHTNPTWSCLALEPSLCVMFCTDHLPDDVGNIIFGQVYEYWLIPVAMRPKAWVCGCLVAGIASLNPARGLEFSLFLRGVCCQVEVSVVGGWLIQGNPTKCGVCECNHEAMIMKRPWPARGSCTKTNI